MDRIRIKNLEIYAHHGVFPEENRLGQLFVISVDMSVDTSEAGRKDALEWSVHYGEACHQIKAWMEESQYKLIESVAQMIASRLLHTYPLIREVTVEVKKPQAPILLHVEYVSVTVTRKWHQVCLGVGSNMGDTKGYIRQALKLLSKCEDIVIEKESEWIVTRPYGKTDQADFLNGCLVIRTLLDPYQLLKTIHEIEKTLGRVRKERWGPRTVDLDILLYDDQVIDSEVLTVPHADMHNRMFVLKPLQEIAGYIRHPVFNKTISQLYSDLAREETAND